MFGRNFPCAKKQQGRQASEGVLEKQEDSVLEFLKINICRSFICLLQKTWKTQ